METMVQQSCDFVVTPRLNLEEWAALLRSTCGGDHKVIDPNAFAGWIRRLKVYGIAAAATGRSGLTQNDHTIKLGVGDIWSHRRRQASTRLSENGAQWLSIYLLRQSVISHLGFEPQACLCGRGDFNDGRMLSVSLRS
jgi:hypothetical protein